MPIQIVPSYSFIQLITAIFKSIPVNGVKSNDLNVLPLYSVKPPQYVRKVPAFPKAPVPIHIFLPTTSISVINPFPIP